MYGDDFSVAPFSVLVDPVRALRVLALEAGRRFSDNVLYVYGKQLEEADVLVINKIDTVAPARLAVLRTALGERCPRAVLFEVSARTGAGLEPWFAHILASDDESRANLDIDYDEYADGEARLGWLNCTARLSGRPFDGNDWVARLVETLQRQLRRRDIEIAHLKITLTPAEHDRDLCVVNAISTDDPPVNPFRLQDVIDAGELIINLRAEGDPEILRREAMDALTAQAANAGLAVTVEHIEHFRPGRPVPTHRVVMA
jgi:G3E family GTPase